MGADAALQLHGAGHAPVLEGQVGELLFGVGEGAADRQENVRKSFDPLHGDPQVLHPDWTTAARIP